MLVGLGKSWNEINCCHISSSNNVVIRRKAVAAAARHVTAATSRWPVVGFFSVAFISPRKWDAHSVEGSWRRRKKIAPSSFLHIYIRWVTTLILVCEARASMKIIVQLEKIWPYHINGWWRDSAGCKCVTLGRFALCWLSRRNVTRMGTTKNDDGRCRQYQYGWVMRCVRNLVKI